MAEGGDGRGDSHGHSHGDGEHLGIIALGMVSLGGETFAVDREGECEGGKQCTFGVERFGEGTASGFEGWVENESGDPVSEPVEGEGHDQHWHFSVTAQPGAQPARFVLRLAGVVSKVELHPGAGPCHDGILTPLRSALGEGIPGPAGDVVGFLELKLHDDCGDLECWFCTDGPMTTPLDFPLDVDIQCTFLTPQPRTVGLKVRDAETNPDEDEKPNIRDGKTNYFIFPGETGADSSWLEGKGFRGTCYITVGNREGRLDCAPFVLVPHQ